MFILDEAFAAHYDSPHARIWAEISRSALHSNIREIQKKIPPTSSLCAVVKADAYGHGAVEVARIACEEGARFLAVATLEEALHLRENGLKCPILLLSGSAPEAAPILAEEELRQCLSSTEEAEAYARELRAHPAPSDRPLLVHIKLDTGMARLGFSAREKDQEKTLDAISAALQFPEIKAEGIFTHFATASAEDTQYRDLQFSRLMAVIQGCEQRGIHFAIRHCANSATIVKEPAYALDMCRAGIILYGGIDGDFMRREIKLTPVMRFVARISTVRELEAGESISYGRIFTTERPMRIGVVEAGYADGVPRILSNRAIFKLHGKDVQQIGRICMDRMMIDLSDVPEARIGDQVTLWGGSGENAVDPEAQAARAETISYELFCGVAPRVPRIIID